jgi:hypothetical protein
MKVFLEQCIARFCKWFLRFVGTRMHLRGSSTTITSAPGTDAATATPIVSTGMRCTHGVQNQGPALERLVDLVRVVDGCVSNVKSA